MNRMLSITYSSDLSKSYLEYIKNDKLDIDVIVRDPSKIDEQIRPMIDKIFEFDLNDIVNLNKFSSNSKYSQIIFFQGIDIIKPFQLYNIDDISKTFNVNFINHFIIKYLISKKYLLKEASIINYFINFWSYQRIRLDMFYILHQKLL